MDAAVSAVRGSSCARRDPQGSSDQGADALVSALRAAGSFEGRALLDPFEEGGGSFTGPFTIEHAERFVLRREIMPSEWGASRFAIFNKTRQLYLRHVDELPHHFQLHIMHAAEIVGYEHSDPWVAEWWRAFYLMIVNDAHLFPESREQMNERLSDNEEAWREREEVTAA